ncbi:hypothetical protein [Roseisalinus antarcticus]|uniref:Autotransporter beta-domain protein n=1 Tax=Roseisalinus antarcticus TaxID=254357 RepID=A0A1Y5RYC6_9RHOB|nr:hypothetical protein [Roseisalinus antarcticus]SLN26946.1 hypothetical protein ROA7023_00847 [Roseisalinus antarcticus]
MSFRSAFLSSLAIALAPAVALACTPYAPTGLLVFPDSPFLQSSPGGSSSTFKITVRDVFGVPILRTSSTGPEICRGAACIGQEITTDVIFVDAKSASLRDMDGTIVLGCFDTANPGSAGSSPPAGSGGSTGSDDAGGAAEPEETPDTDETDDPTESDRNSSTGGSDSDEDSGQEDEITAPGDDADQFEYDTESDDPAPEKTAEERRNERLLREARQARERRVRLEVEALERSRSIRLLTPAFQREIYGIEPVDVFFSRPTPPAPDAGDLAGAGSVQRNAPDFDFGLTVSTRNSPGQAGASPFGAVFLVRHSSYSGDLDGGATDLGVGLDFGLGDSTRVMVVYELSSANLYSDDADLQIYETTPGVSLSVVHQRENMQVSGFLRYGRPDYEIEGETARTTRLTAGAQGSVEFALGAARLTALSSVALAREDGFVIDLPSSRHDAPTLDQRNASVGARLDLPELEGGITPYVSAEAVWVQSETENGTVEDTGHRAGFGMVAQDGPMSLNLDVSLGEVFEGVSSVSVSMGYLIRF